MSDHTAAIVYVDALAELATTAFEDDDLTGGLRRLATAIQRGEVRDIAAWLDPVRGAPLSRIRIAPQVPTLDLLRALWVVLGVGDGAELRAELDPLARAWLDVATWRTRARAVVDLVEWSHRNEGALVRALRGPR